MSFVRITEMWTMDPAQPWNPKSSFFYADPFGVMMRLQCSQDVIDAGLRYDIEWQLVCPREDINGQGWWSEFSTGDAALSPTVDVRYEDQPFSWNDFGHWIYWRRYGDAFRVIGAHTLPGVFAVRGHIQVVGSDLFDMTDPFAFKYQLRRE
jgi:hypothetical protein